MAAKTYDVEQFATHLGNALQFLKTAGDKATSGVTSTGNDVISQIGQKTGTSATAVTHGASLQYGGGYAGNYQGDGNQDGLYESILTGIGAPLTAANMQFMRAWNQAEGMPAGVYNPFATTQGAAGDSYWNTFGDDYHVRIYPDEQTGASATVQTLQNGNYQGILDALQQGSDPMAAAYAVANSGWGTGTGVIRVLGGG